MKLLASLVLLPFLTLGAFGQSLPAQRSPQYDPRAPQGLFDLLVYVDAEAFIYVRDDKVTYMTLSGSAPRSAGTNYTQPLPRGNFTGFNMSKVAGRGTVELTEQPGPGNNYTAVLRIIDKQGGADLYHVQLTWNVSSAASNGGYDDRRSNGRNDRRDSRQGGSPQDSRYNARSEFEFHGRVDDVTVLRIQGDRVRSENVSGRRLSGEQFHFSEPIPTRTISTFDLTDTNGRGEIELIEKPSARNRYTAVVRITDKQPGAGDYSFKLDWNR